MNHLWVKFQVHEDECMPRRKDADGFTIYTEDELKVGKGGKTPLCPFDCECCF